MTSAKTIGMSNVGDQTSLVNIDQGSGITAKGNDTEQSFMVAEINGDEMHFNAVSRLGQVVDSGVITRRKQPSPLPSP